MRLPHARYGCLSQIVDTILPSELSTAGDAKDSTAWKSGEIGQRLDARNTAPLLN